VRGGIVYRTPGVGIADTHPYDVGGFARATAELSLRSPFLLKTMLGARLFGGGYFSPDSPARQRRIMLAGADPYETFTDPLVRSRRALFVGPDFHYQSPGDANLRAFQPDLGGRWAVALNLEDTKTLYRRPQGGTGLLSDASLEAFLDAGVVDTAAVPAPPGGQAYTTLYDGGIGLVTRHRINELAWTMRFEVPFVVNRWNYAADGTGKRVAFRWVFSLAPSF
jgi:hypothetical protein